MSERDEGKRVCEKNEPGIKEGRKEVVVTNVHARQGWLRSPLSTAVGGFCNDADVSLAEQRS